MGETAARFSDELRKAVGVWAKSLEGIEYYLRYCESIPETSLTQPPGGAENWKRGVQFRVHGFANASLRRVEQLVLGLIAESNANRLDTVVILARAIIENTATVYYAYKMAEAHKRNNKRDAMDENLNRLLLGANRQENPDGKKIKPVPVDTSIGKIDDDHKGTDLRDHYTWLSDFVHPNGPALCFFHQTLEEKTPTVNFKKTVPLEAAWASQIYPAVALGLMLAHEGWKWMLALKWE